MTAYTDKLLPLCRQLGQTALAMTRVVPAESIKVGNPQMLALALLCRTMGNFKGTVQLVESKMLVEARVLARCCFENLFIIGGMHKVGAPFIEKMKADDRAGRKARLKFVMENEGYFQALSDETREEMEKAKEVLSSFEKGSYLKFKEASQVGPSKEVYLAYIQYSGDAAHPTMTALFRHFQREEDGFVFDVAPEPKDHQLDETLHLACLAILSVMVIANEMLGTGMGAKLVELNTELLTLQHEQYGEKSLAEGMEIK
jgi:hypothetical protein